MPEPESEESTAELIASLAVRTEYEKDAAELKTAVPFYQIMCPHGSLLLPASQEKHLVLFIAVDESDRDFFRRAACARRYGDLFSVESENDLAAVLVVLGVASFPGEGEPEKYIRDRPGHSTNSAITKVYEHTFRDRDAVYDRRIEDL